MLFAPIFLTRITFRDIFQRDFFLRVIFAINIIFLVKIIHLMTKWQFVGLKRGITGLKQAWYASTIKFLDCQLTLGPDLPIPRLTPRWELRLRPQVRKSLFWQNDYTDFLFWKASLFLVSSVHLTCVRIMCILCFRNLQILFCQGTNILSFNIESFVIYIDDILSSRYGYANIFFFYSKGI